MRTPFKTLLLLTGVLLAGTPFARAVIGTSTTINFGELPAGPINGLNILGVTFGFTINGVASTDAGISSPPGLGNTPLVTLPVLEGTTQGQLTLDFSTAIVFLQFGSHLSSQTNVTAGLGVQFYDSGMTPLGGMMSLDMTPSPDFAGGLFQYDGAAASHAMIQFNDQAAGRFAIDNLIFVPVPEPNLAWLAIPVLAGGLVWQRRMRNGSNVR